MPEQEEVEGCAKELNIVDTRNGARFERSEPRERAVKYSQGLMSDIPRNNGWQLAEYAGEATLDGMQRLLGTAAWDVDGVRDDLRAYVVEEIGTPCVAGRWQDRGRCGCPFTGTVSGGQENL